MIQQLFMDYASKMQVATYVGVEDFADRFNFIFTVIVLLICTAVVTVKQYILKPISCYISTDVGGKNLLDYVENYCWVQGTIPISYSNDVPETEDDWNRLESHKILYYQWVPFVLGLQCILFYIPRVIWQIICYNQTGTDLYHLISMANEACHSKPDKREEMVQNLAKSIERLLYHRCAIKEGKSKLISKRMGPLGSNTFLQQVFKYRTTLVVPTYLLIKLLCLANSLAQLFLMQIFLGFRITKAPYGLIVLYDLFAGKDWQATLAFPRVAFCYIKVKNLGARANAITAQCALPVNMLNERIYVFLWWWILCGGFLTLCSLGAWVVHVMSRESTTRYVERHLDLRIDDADPEEERLFVTKFIRQDGVFLLRMIAINSGEIVAGDVIGVLWQLYRDKRGLKTPNRSLSCTTANRVEPPQIDGGLRPPSSAENKKGNNLHREIRTGKAARLKRKAFKFCSIFCIGKRLGNRLFGTYLMIKALYVLNAVGQIQILESFIGLDRKAYSYLGVTMTRNIIDGKDWQATLNFPRVGFCVVPIRQLAGQVYVTAQCALPVNMLNERLYVFLWYWFFLGAVVTITSVPLWLLRMTYQRGRTRFVKRYLRLNELCSREDNIMVQKFCQQFLRHDGIFLLRMMAINSGSTICGEVVQKLWSIYKTKYYNQDFNHADNEVEEEASESDFPGVVGRHHTTIQLDAVKPSAPPPSSSSGYSEDFELKKQPI
uniref:Innexin n=1 Tax=Echinococcus granulosus TaxID=6210 RepID=A0A068WRL7_ECHGR|nr:innexin [Echinococcus granulosus]